VIRASFRSIKLAYVANVVSRGDKFNDIHTWGANDALSETSNGLKCIWSSNFKIRSWSEVEQLARGLKLVLGRLRVSD
jgi:hypothetical protein